jgi:ATP:corrinoid adenosyltransferase
MEENTQPEDNLADEFRNLGKNIIDAVHTAWERPERQRLQEDIEKGLSEFSASIRQEADKFNESPTSQRMKSDAEKIQTRFKNGEFETKVRDELLTALQAVNSELEKVTQKFKVKEPEQAPNEETQNYSNEEG